MNEIVEEVVKRIQQQQQNTFEVEASGRHVHLSRQEIDALFGPGYQLTKVKDYHNLDSSFVKNELRLLDLKDSKCGYFRP